MYFYCVLSWILVAEKVVDGKVQSVTHVIKAVK